MCLSRIHRFSIRLVYHTHEVFINSFIIPGAHVIIACHLEINALFDALDFYSGLSYDVFSSYDISS